MARKSSAARAAEDNELDVDYSERNGFLTGKSAALADWFHRKEDANYEKLFERLYKRNRRRLALVAHGVPFVDVDGVSRRVFNVVCHVCREPVTKLQPNARWCSKRCANRYHSLPRSRARNRGIRNMTIAPTALTHLELAPGLTLRELHALMPEAKYGSLATLLCLWTKQGVLIHVGPKFRGVRYALAGQRPTHPKETER